jgi:signal transduction histidine kinase
MLKIINDVLDLSKIEAGKLVLDAVDFHLYDVMVEALTIASQTATEKGLHLSAVIDPELPTAVRGIRDDCGRSC